MIRKSIIALCLLAMTACGQQSADGYEFEGAEYRQTEFTVKVVEHTNLFHLRQSYPGTLEEGQNLFAYARLNAGHCEVHVVKAERVYAPEWMGHEFAHCIYGRWHPAKKSAP